MLQKIPIFKYFDFSQYVPQTEFGTFLKQISLPVWIIVLNQLLIFLIDYAGKSPYLTQLNVISLPGEASFLHAMSDVNLFKIDTYVIHRIHQIS